MAKNIDTGELERIGGNRFNVYELFASTIEREVLKTDDYSLKLKYRDLELGILKIERIARDLRGDKINNFLVSKCESLLQLWLAISKSYFDDSFVVLALNDRINRLVEFMETPFLYKRENTDKQVNAYIAKTFHPNMEELGYFTKKLVDDKKNTGQSLNQNVTINPETGAVVLGAGSFYKSKGARVYGYSGSLHIPREVQAVMLRILLRENDEKGGVLYNSDILSYEWSVDAKFQSNNISEIAFFLWTLSEGLSQIEGVEVILEDWGKGSFWAKLKIKMSDWLAKEETKDILDKTRKATEAYYLDRHIEGVEKTKIESRKLEEDIKRLMSEEKTKEYHELDIQNKKLDLIEKGEKIKSARLSNQQKKIEMIKSLSELIKSGIVKVDSDFQISINELLYCENKEGTFIVGENLDEVDESGEKNIPESE